MLSLNAQHQRWPMQELTLRLSSLVVYFWQKIGKSKQKNYWENIEQTESCGRRAHYCQPTTPEAIPRW